MGEKFILLNKKLCFGLASLLRLPETFILDARAIFELVFKINLGREKDNKSLIAHFSCPTKLYYCYFKRLYVLLLGTIVKRMMICFILSQLLPKNIAIPKAFFPVFPSLKTLRIVFIT